MSSATLRATNQIVTASGRYEKPVETMRSYLDAMDAAAYTAPEADERIPLVLAALGPRMLDLAAERADGV